MDTGSAQRWEQLYNQRPLNSEPGHFAAINQSQFMLDYLTTVLKCCPQGGRTLETGVGSGLGTIWLSKRGFLAEGIDYSQPIVERAVQVNNLLGGNARFHLGDLTRLYREGAPRWNVIHHQGVLEHFPRPMQRAILAQQVASSDRVVFSIPSVHYNASEFGDERLLTLEALEYVLASFHIEEIRYYGDPQFGGQEHLLCVLSGQRVDNRLRALMDPTANPYKPGISVVVLAHNESKNIEPCLKSFAGQVEQTIVCDMESTDDTAELAKPLADLVISHPNKRNFDAARNVAAIFAEYEWILILDSDERVPPGLIPALRSLVADYPGPLSGVYLPFRHIFVGHAMQCLYPGYTAPRFLRNGHFVFLPRLHAGVSVDGPTTQFPADNPTLALEHQSFPDMRSYMTKLNNYTDGEAESGFRDGRMTNWKIAFARMFGDYRGYFDHMGARRDGPLGHIYSIFSGIYRLVEEAKLFELRLRHGLLQPSELEVPENVEEALLYALDYIRQPPQAQITPVQVAVEGSEDAAGVVCSAPLWDQSGFGDDCRNLFFAMDE